MGFLRAQAEDSPCYDPVAMLPLSLYVHIPFCRHKCHYCDFNTYAGLQRLIPAYLQALATEARRWAGLAAGWEVRTVFFGGGTPSLLSPEQVRGFLDVCRECFALAADPEISLEANPGTVDREKLAGYWAAGVNRLSFGAQSFDPGELRWLGREHSAAQVGEAVRAAREAGFQRLNLDLIYGLPEQDPATWRRTLAQALALAPDHLSLYALTIEEGTPLGRRLEEGRVREPDPDTAADQYEAASEVLDAAGFRNYEISNWARPGQECRHNLTYWRNMPYLGLGAGAHSCFGGFRFSNVLLPGEYIRRVEAGTRAGSPGRIRTMFPNPSDTVRGAIEAMGPVAGIEAVGPETDLSDSLVLGLRLAEGVDFAGLRERHGVDVRQRFAAAIGEMERLGLLEVDQSGMRVTPMGRLVANEIFIRFLPQAVAP